MMPQLKELKGTALAIKPAFTKNEERLIGSPAMVSFAASIGFLRFSNLVNLITKRLKSSINKKGSMKSFATANKKKATKMTALMDRNRFRKIAAKTPMVSRILADHQMMVKFLLTLADHFLKVPRMAL